MTYTRGLTELFELFLFTSSLFVSNLSLSSSSSSSFSSSSSPSSFSVHDTSMYLGESVPVTSKYLTPPMLLQSAVLTAPSSSSTITADQAKRMRIASLSTLYVVLLRWKEIQEYSVQNKIAWPYVENDVLSLIFLQMMQTQHFYLRVVDMI